MRILHVITSLRIGGAEKLMVDLLPRLKDLGNDVEILLFDGEPTPFYNQLNRAGIIIHTVRIGGNVYDLRNIFSLYRLYNNYDIIHTHNTAPQLFASIAKFIHPKSHVKLITTEHNTTNRRRDKPILKPLDKWMYRRYDRIICISEQTEFKLRHYLDDFSTKICTIYNGIDTSVFSKHVTNSRKSSSSTIITMVAAFREQKDQPTLIRALSLLPDSFVLQLVGTGEDFLIKQCKQLAFELKVVDRVHFLGVRTDIPEILHNSDIVVLSSHYEGFGLSVVEGMASGKPVIASDVDGLHEIVNGYGLLFPHKDAQSLADIVLNLSEDKALSGQIAGRCQERAYEFDIHKMAEKYNDIYKSLI